MSIVVAVHKNGRTAMAADTLVCFGESQRVPTSNASTLKVWTMGSALMGGTGWAIYDDIIRDHVESAEEPADLESASSIFAFFLDLWRQLHDKYTFVNDQAANKDTPFGDLDSSFLIASRGGMFKVSSDLGVTRFNQYYAIGCAAEYALGAMHQLYDTDLDAATIARRAVETAIALDIHCGGDITELSLDEPRDS